MVAMNSAPTAPVTPAMAMTGSLFTLVSSCLRMILTENRYPLFRDHAPETKKAPVLFRRGFGSTGAKSSTTRARLLEPSGSSGFLWWFSQSTSWRGLMRERLADVNGASLENPPQHG